MHPLRRGALPVAIGEAGVGAKHFPTGFDLRRGPPRKCFAILYSDATLDALKRVANGIVNKTQGAGIAAAGKLTVNSHEISPKHL